MDVAGLCDAFCLHGIFCSAVCPQASRPWMTITHPALRLLDSPGADHPHSRTLPTQLGAARRAAREWRSLNSSSKQTCRLSKARRSAEETRPASAEQVRAQTKLQHA
eukprot:5045116-Pleurochrysis_carterae.AAC.1